MVKQLARLNNFRNTYDTQHVFVIKYSCNHMHRRKEYFTRFSGAIGIPWVLLEMLQNDRKIEWFKKKFVCTCQKLLIAYEYLNLKFVLVVIISAYNGSSSMSVVFSFLGKLNCWCCTVGMHERIGRIKYNYKICTSTLFLYTMVSNWVIEHFVC